MEEFLKRMLDRYFKVYFALTLMGFVLMILLMTVPQLRR